jgi:hypothetical protein
MCIIHLELIFLSGSLDLFCLSLLCSSPNSSQISIAADKEGGVLEESW